MSAEKIEIVAGNDAEGVASKLLRLTFVLPVISSHEEGVEHVDARTIRIAKRNGSLTIRTDSAAGFDAFTKERTFNLVPGFECLPLIVVMQPGKEIHVELSAEQKS